MTDRALDIEVAEKVMGLKQPDDFGVVPLHTWAFDQDDEYNTYVCKRCRLSSKDWARPEELKAGPCNLTPFLPYYSTRINAAWEVVEHLQRQGFAIWLHWPDHGSMEPRFENWRAEIFGTQLPSVTVEANSAPLAICRAALRASADTPPSAGPSSSVA